MPKRLRDCPLYVAPGIIGVLKQDGTTIVYDETNGVEVNPYDIEHKIYIYEKQVKGWFLEAAKSIANQENTIFLVLMVCLSYVEGVEQYRRGQDSHGNSRQWFCDGIRRMFELENISNLKINKLYKHGRCGLFHVGMSGGDVVVSTRFNEAINFSDSATITINTEIFLNTLIQDFEAYINELNQKGNDELRRNFDQMYTLV